MLLKTIIAYLILLPFVLFFALVLLRAGQNPPKPPSGNKSKNIRN
jgi:hypothetical protein